MIYILFINYIICKIVMYCNSIVIYNTNVKTTSTKFKILINSKV